MREKPVNKKGAVTRAFLILYGKSVLLHYSFIKIQVVHYLDKATRLAGFADRRRTFEPESGRTFPFR